MIVKGALPRPLSHSSISIYKECPQKYKFKYIDKIPEKPRHFFSFGSSVHSALEFFYGGMALPAPSLSDVLKFYKENWIAKGYKDAAQEEKYFADGRTILTEFYQKHIATFALPYFVEYNFNFEVEGVPVTGKIDRIDKNEDGSLVIIDYKTGKAIAPERVLKDEQLTMYQLACETQLGAPVSKLVFYHLPSLTELPSQPHDPKQVNKLRAGIVNTAESIVAGAFEPAPDEKKCFWCDFKPICPVFRHQFPAPAATPAAAAEVPEPSPPDEELSAAIDRYGELRAESDRLNAEAQKIRGQILEILREKGYVRAFGSRYELVLEPETRWEFRDKAKVLELIRQAGLYDRILAPSAPKVEKLLDDPELDGSLRESLQSLADKFDASQLRVKPLTSRSS